MTKHYRLTLPNNDDLGEAIIGALNRGVAAGTVVPHDEPGSVTSGMVVTFDTADERLQKIIEITRLASPRGFRVEVSEHEEESGLRPDGLRGYPRVV